MTLDLIVTALASLLLVLWWKERVLYVIFTWAYVQNFVLAWMYTSGWAGKDLCQALLISKEFLLLWLFVYFLPVLFRYGRGRWTLPVQALAVFTGWCVLRYAAAVVLQGQGFFENLWNLRMACFPFQILTVAIGVAFVKPQFATKFIRRMVYLVVCLAAVGIALYLLPGPTFWRDHVDIATYNIDVKGDTTALDEPGAALAAAAGTTGNGLAGVEEENPAEFLAFSNFRAFGTVGDAIGFGHFVAFPVLLLALWWRRNWKSALMLFITSIGLFFSFTRSAWIFVAVGLVYALLRRGYYRVLCSAAGLLVLAMFIWQPLRDWLYTSMAVLSWSSPDSEHAEGFIGFYKTQLWKVGNIFGQGMTARVSESGYAVLLIRYGLPAVIGFVFFCVVLYKSFRKTSLRGKPLFLVAQAIPLAMLVTLNFSYYPFGFIPYLLTWFVLGVCLVVAGATGGALNGIGGAQPQAVQGGTL